MSTLPWPFNDFGSNDTREGVGVPRLYRQARCPCCDGRGWIFETSETTITPTDDD